jgi:hypothetical protein
VPRSGDADQPALAGPRFSAWSTAQKVDEIADNHADVNTASLDRCPIQSQDGLSLYMASNRPGSMESSPGVRSLDIWVAYRESTDAPFGEPVNLGSPLNSAADDFCPTTVRGNGLFFVSRKVVAGVTCGLGDIYFTRFNPHHGWRTPEHLGCAPAGRPEHGTRRARPLLRLCRRRAGEEHWDVLVTATKEYDLIRLPEEG